MVGFIDGLVVGRKETVMLGNNEGEKEGLLDGKFVGLTVEIALGNLVTVFVGSKVGRAEFSIVGLLLVEKVLGVILLL